MDVVLLGLPHKVSAQKVPEIMADRRAHRRSVGRLSPARSGRLREVLRRRAPLPGRAHARHVRLRAAGAQPRGDPRGAVRRVARLLRDDDRARAPAAGEGRAARRRGRDRRHHRLERQRRRADARGRTTPCARTTCGRTSRSSTSTSPRSRRRSATPARRTSTLRFVPVSAPLSRGIFATCFAHVDASVDAGTVAGAVRRGYAREPFVRVPAKRLPEVVAVKGTNYAEVGAVSRRRGRRQAPRRVLRGDRQPHQGRRRPGDPVDEPDARPRRATHARGPRRLAVTASPVVIKLGGEVVASPHMAAIAADVAEMHARGERVVVVHGGGPQATELQKRLGQTPQIVAGRRVTDADTLEVMKMVVAGKVNVDPCSALLAAGARPVGLHGASALTVRATKRPPRVVAGGGPEPIDFGHVGDVDRREPRAPRAPVRRGLRAGRRVPRRGRGRQRLQHQRRHRRQPARRRARRQGAGPGQRRPRRAARRGRPRLAHPAARRRRRPEGHRRRRRHARDDPEARGVVRRDRGGRARGAHRRAAWSAASLRARSASREAWAPCSRDKKRTASFETVPSIRGDEPAAYVRARFSQRARCRSPMRWPAR